MSFTFECDANNEIIRIPDAIESFDIYYSNNLSVSICSNSIQLYNLSRFEVLHAETLEMEVLSNYEKYIDGTHTLSYSNLYCSNLNVSNLNVSNLFIENATNSGNMAYFQNTNTTFHGSLDIENTLSVSQVFSIDYPNTNVVERVSNIVTAILPNLSSHRQFFLQNFLNVPFANLLSSDGSSNYKIHMNSTHPNYDPLNLNGLTFNYFASSNSMHICDAHDQIQASNLSIDLSSDPQSFEDDTSYDSNLYMYYFISSNGAPLTATYETRALVLSPVGFSNPGEHTWTSQITGSITVKLRGGNGGTWNESSTIRSGGNGGYITVNLNVQSGVDYELFVGGVGSNNHVLNTAPKQRPQRDGAGAGGASGIKAVGGDWLVIAGGGGGGARSGRGGAGGIPSAWNGSDGQGTHDARGKGATITAAGLGGGSGSGVDNVRSNGVDGVGHNGGDGYTESVDKKIPGGIGVGIGGDGGFGSKDYSGGGGGGGWFGGGGGGVDTSGDGWPGGGGSTYYDVSSISVTDIQNIALTDWNVGNGYIEIEYL